MATTEPAAPPATEPAAPPAEANRSHRAWKWVAIVGVVIAGLVAAGVIGWAIRGSGTATPTPSTAQAGQVYDAMASVVNPLCGGIGAPSEANEGGSCGTALSSMAALLRSYTWPEGASQKSTVLANAIDKHLAFLHRMDAATPAERLQLAQEAVRQYPNNPWQVTHVAAYAMRQALGLTSNGSLLT